LLPSLVLSAFLASIYPDPSMQDVTKSISTERTPKLLIFVSFTMSGEILKNLFREAQKNEGDLVLRGLYKNSFKATALKLQKLRIEALIDPTLFEKFQVKSVPTFVLRENSSEEFKSLSGNVTFNYVLQKFKKEGS
jgi:conjugal transfer pilus assembly protein TrbC